MFLVEQEHYSVWCFFFPIAQTKYVRVQCGFFFLIFAKWKPLQKHIVEGLQELEYIKADQATIWNYRHA